MSKGSRGLWPGVVVAMASAVLFGASTPFAKRLLGEGVSPWLLAGLLYLGSGAGLSVLHGARFLLGLKPTEAPLRRSDWPWLCLIILTGGIIGPVLLMVGLITTAASTAALLLNLEGLATMVIAWLVYKEGADRRLVLGALAILAGALLVAWRGGPMNAGLGALAIVGACLAWGVDNNLTRKLSSADPMQIALIKGWAAGSVNLALALALGARLPPIAQTAGAGAIGFLGYGISLTLFVLALRYLGAARTGAYFSTAPFIGAVLSIVMFGEALTARLAAAGGLMAVGLYIHLTERHSHTHRHETMDHEHLHVHDDHHQHPHDPGDPAGEPHSHPHHHAPLRHRHSHFPDLHHRHGHG